MISSTSNVHSFISEVINAGVAGCCTGLALSFPGIFRLNKLMNLPFL